MAAVDLGAAVGAFEALAVVELVSNCHGRTIVSAHENLESAFCTVTLESSVVFEALATVEDTRDATGIVQARVTNRVRGEWGFASRA